MGNHIPRDGYVIPPLFWPTVVLPGILTVVPMLYPFIEARINKDKAAHNLLQRPRDVPARTGLGAMAIAFFVVLTISGANDVIADKFRISLNAMTWAGRIGLLCCRRWRTTSPTGSAWVSSSTTGRCWPTVWRPASSGACPTAGSMEVHQPLAGSDGHGNPICRTLAGPCPKKMNRLGALAPAIRGFFCPDREAGERPAGQPPVAGARPRGDWRRRSR